MKDMLNTLQMAFAALGGALGAVMGGFDGFLYALIVFVIVDYVTGVVVAIDTKTLSSKIGFKGIAKKVLIFCLVALAHIIDSKIIQTGSVVRTAVIFFYISNEGISILENSSILGLPIPKKLRDVLEQINETTEEDNDEDSRIDSDQ